MLKILDPRLEMYPSIVLPSGSKKCVLLDTVRITVSEVYGLTPRGTLKNLDKSSFLQNIRVQYLDHLYHHNFGLTRFQTQNSRTNRLGIPFSITSKVSEEDIAETKIWLRSRLTEQGCSDSVLILKKKHMMVLKDGRYHEDKTVPSENDTILDLY